MGGAQLVDPQLLGIDESSTLTVDLPLKIFFDLNALRCQFLGLKQFWGEARDIRGYVGISELCKG